MAKHIRISSERDIGSKGVEKEKYFMGWGRGDIPQFVIVYGAGGVREHYSSESSDKAEPTFN